MADQAEISTRLPKAKSAMCASAMISLLLMRAKSLEKIVLTIRAWAMATDKRAGNGPGEQLPPSKSCPIVDLDEYPIQVGEARHAQKHAHAVKGRNWLVFVSGFHNKMEQGDYPRPGPSAGLASPVRGISQKQPGEWRSVRAKKIHRVQNVIHNALKQGRFPFF